MTRRYAEGTTVSVDTSRGELSGLLTAHGCQRMAWATEPDADTLQFFLGGNGYRFRIARPTEAEVIARWDDEHPYAAAGQRAKIDWRKNVDAEWRRRWRALVLLLKAKLEFVEAGDTTLEQEFMSALLVEGGARTLGEWMDSGPGAKLLGPGR